MRTTFSIVHSLLNVDEGQTLARSPRAKLYAVILAFVNLFPSGFSEKILRSDETGYHLALFLFIHSVVYSLFALSYFNSNSKEILHKSKLFPTNSLSRIAFVVISNIRHPFSIALLASNSLFLVILFRTEILVSATAVLMYLLLTLNVSVISSAAFLLLENKNQSANLAIAFVAMLSFVVLAAALVFRLDSTLTNAPLVSSVVTAILNTKNGNYLDTITQTLLLVGIPALVVLFTKRFV